MILKKELTEVINQVMDETYSNDLADKIIEKLQEREAKIERDSEKADEDCLEELRKDNPYATLSCHDHSPFRGPCSDCGQY